MAKNRAFQHGTEVILEESKSDKTFGMKKVYVKVMVVKKVIFHISTISHKCM